MKKLLSILLVAFSVNCFGQTGLQKNDLLPVDPKLSTGKLENGMTYYVRANSTPKNRADMFLAVRVGSVSEDSDQLGLAHFCEHMAFNGTKNFPKNELTSYLESLGMEFGPEINAYTSFDETVYMIKVPLDSALFVEKGLQVLYDWACQVSYFDEDIENERGVIREEWRGGRDANERMLQKWLPVFLAGSRYADRLPIGKIEIIDHFKTDVIRRFYNDWYRPDLQAIIIVGDFDQQKMVRQVKEMFSKIPARPNPRQRELFDIPDHQDTKISIVTDKEVQYPVAQVFYKHPMKIAKTLGDYREMIIENLYNGMINIRLNELTQTENPPFIYGGSSFSELFGPKSVYASVAVCQIGKITDGIRAVLTENERVKQFGFTASELERQKASMLKSIEKAYNERDKQESVNYAEEYKRNFLFTEEPIPGIENEFAYYHAFMPGIAIEEVNALAKKWITQENRVVVITAPEIEGTKISTEQEILSMLGEIETQKIEAYQDKVGNQPLIGQEPVSGKITSVKTIGEVGATEWKLSNGATVVIKSTDYKDDEILFTAYSQGGNSLYGQEDDISADIATTILTMSGIADFDNITLDKMLSDKVFSLSPYISDLTEGFSGSSSVQDMETLFQMLYLYFTRQRTDPVSYSSYINRMKAMLENKKASPEAAFKDTFLVTSVNYHPRKRPMTVELLDEARLDRIAQITSERFSDASDFKFFFVGNIDQEKLKPLVEKYIGSIPSTYSGERWKDLHIESPSGVIEKTVYRGQEEKSIHYMSFHGTFDYSKENVIAITALGKILSTRLLEVIREDKSSVYYIDASPSINKYPEAEYSMTIYFGTAPEKVGELKEAVFAEIRDIAQNGPSEEELNKAKEKLLREREVNLRENKFWLGALSSYYRNYDGDFSEFGAFNEVVNSLTIGTIKNASSEYLDFNNYFSVTLKPESAKK
ncbi:MAG: insulinase family protein [Prolixibacteraceae bacterium]|jgi:zinc protease|nr:insulinase family protein [Prolixibacteraceae bacterium]